MTDPVIQVIRGNPTDEEVAALTLAVLSLQRAGARPAPAHRSSWSAYWRGVRPAVEPGPDGWRRSARIP